MVSDDKKNAPDKAGHDYLIFDIKGDIRYVVEGDIITIEGVKSKVRVPITARNIHVLTGILNKTFERRKNITMADGDIEALTRISGEHPVRGGDELSLGFVNIGSYTVEEGEEVENAYPVKIHMASTPESMAKAAGIIEKYYLRNDGLGRFFLASLTGMDLIPSDVINI